MVKITTEREYTVVCERIEELLSIVDNNTSKTDKNFIELNLLSDMVADYEEETIPIEKPNLIDIIQLRMFEKGLNQKKLSELVGVSTSRISEYLSGKSEPPLKVARLLSQKLDIDPAIVLGV